MMLTPEVETSHYHSAQGWLFMTSVADLIGHNSVPLLFKLLEQVRGRNLNERMRSVRTWPNI